MKDRPFVIWSLSFSASVGGSIVLHYLCHLINSLGYKAYIWPGARWKTYKIRTISENRSIEIAQRVMRMAKNKLKRDTYFVHPELVTPVAKPDMLDDAIVVYPEIVDGNPLSCPRVVRWLLHKPGHHTGSVDYGKNDLFFHYQEYFNDPNISNNPNNLLRIRWLRDDVYRQMNFGPRRGSCYLVRKGIARPDMTKIKNARRIDNYGHRRVAKIFNQTETFYSYDLYTMYCAYAALCGCVPVVVPQPGVSREDWRANPEDRYGVAYGTSEIDWAIETRHLLIDRIYREKAAERDMVQSFIDKTAAYFD